MGEEVSEEVGEGASDEGDAEIGEELGEDAVEDGSGEQLEGGEEVQCHDVDLDYRDEKGEIVEDEEEKEGLEEREAGKAEAEVNG